MYELYLCHHGIKGQKWGVRKRTESNQRFMDMVQRNSAALEADRQFMNMMFYS